MHAMKRRQFLVTALAAAAGIGVRRPKPEPPKDYEAAIAVWDAAVNNCRRQSIQWPTTEGTHVLRRDGDELYWLPVMITWPEAWRDIHKLS